MKLVSGRSVSIPAPKRHWYDGAAENVSEHWKQYLAVVIGVPAVAIAGFGKKLGLTDWDVYTQFTDRLQNRSFKYILLNRVGYDKRANRVREAFKRT